MGAQCNPNLAIASVLAGSSAGVIGADVAFQLDTLINLKLYPDNNSLILDNETLVLMVL